MATSLTPADFLQRSGVEQMIADFKQRLSTQQRKLIVSDVTDPSGHQYVDLVQEGGGVLGIALVGYTYVLEQMGIRFFSLAGTSAGSINAMLIACGGNKEDEKSTHIIGELAKLDMFTFVDGKDGNWRFTRRIKRIIQKIIIGSHMIRNFARFLLIIAASLLLTSIGCFIFNFFFPGAAKWIGLSAAILLLLIIIIAFAFRKMFRQFATHGYGLNSGNAFRNWIRGLIEQCNVKNDPANGAIRNLADFGCHFMRVPELRVKEDSRRDNNNPPVMPMLTIITCDIIAERKIEFPQMWDLYWKTLESVHPGDFVRASMSIPIFFETFTLPNIRQNSSFEIWDRHLNWENEKKNIPDICEFIDGGTLSNFPINVFYNPNYPVPRMPTLGIRLQDGILDSVNRDNKTFSGYLLSLFSTIRFNFDRDFITKNRAYTVGVKNIDVRDHSWLNFFMQDDEKIELFVKGAKAAIEFLDAFDWENYKSERLRNFKMQEERFDNPNNLDTFPYSSVHPDTGAPA